MPIAFLPLKKEVKVSVGIHICTGRTYRERKRRERERERDLYLKKTLEIQKERRINTYIIKITENPACSMKRLWYTP